MSDVGFPRRACFLARRGIRSSSGVRLATLPRRRWQPPASAAFWCTPDSLLMIFEDDQAHSFRHTRLQSMGTALRRTGQLRLLRARLTSATTFSQPTRFTGTSPPRCREAIGPVTSIFAALLSATRRERHFRGIWVLPPTSAIAVSRADGLGSLAAVNSPGPDAPTGFRPRRENAL